jgi:hypothetical protein
VAQYRTGDWSAAVAALEKSMGLRAGGDVYDWLFLAMACRRLGNAAGAKQWYDRSLEAIKDRGPEKSELNRFRAEAACLLGEKSEAKGTLATLGPRPETVGRAFRRVRETRSEHLVDRASQKYARPLRVDRSGQDRRYEIIEILSSV